MADTPSTSRDKAPEVAIGEPDAAPGDIEALAKVVATWPVLPEVAMPEPAFPVPAWTPMRQTAGYAYDDDNLRDYAARWALYASAAALAERDAARWEAEEARRKLEVSAGVNIDYEKLLVKAESERDALRKSQTAAVTAMNAMAEQKAFFQSEHAALLANAAGVQSEREANAILTTENDALRQELAETQQACDTNFASVGKAMALCNSLRQELEALRGTVSAALKARDDFGWSRDTDDALDKLREGAWPAETQGWRLVPVEPTPAMMDAMEACSDDWPRTTWRQAWDAALNASPGASPQPAPAREGRQPLTPEQVTALLLELNSACVESESPSAMFSVIVRTIEAAHGIGSAKGDEA